MQTTQTSPPTTSRRSHSKRSSSKAPLDPQIAFIENEIQKAIPGFALLFLALFLLIVATFLRRNGYRIGAELVWLSSALSLIIGSIMLIVQVLKGLWPLIALILFFSVVAVR